MKLIFHVNKQLCANIGQCVHTIIELFKSEDEILIALRKCVLAN